MRFYAIGNQYLSSIQQGIQAFHCLGEMVNQYPKDGDHFANKVMHEWLTDHKTLICLNGGNNTKLEEMLDFLQTASYKNSYPWAYFCEDEASMGGMLTCVGIVVPEEIYGIDVDNPTSWGSLTPWEIELALRLKRMPTAR
jgi:hypothetical protein